MLTSQWGICLYLIAWILDLVGDHTGIRTHVLTRLQSNNGEFSYRGVWPNTTYVSTNSSGTSANNSVKFYIYKDKLNCLTHDGIN